MKIKLFEKYEFDDSGDIAEEYAKEIISEYLDNLIDDKTLQDAFDKHCEELDIEQRGWVHDSIINIMSNLRKEVHTLEVSDNYYLKKKSKKYNI